jgi:DNA topoisomerase IA
MKTIFMVAEKPSLAQSLAKILARGGQVNSRKGFNGACSVHEFVARFPPTNETARFKFTSVCGHVMSLDFIGKYNNWDKVDPVSTILLSNRRGGFSKLYAVGVEAFFTSLLLMVVTDFL